MIKRALSIDVISHNAHFLWGPRKTGKTTVLRELFPQAHYVDLLLTEVRTRYLLDPSRFRQEVLAAAPSVVIIDEVQKVPALLDEVHWLLENTKTRCILCGSSARKLRRGAANLLGGRAWRHELFPLTTAELGHPDLERILNHGLLPQHYLSDQPDPFLQAYVGDYLTEEIQAEALTRNIPAFAKFLTAVAFTHGELFNYANVGRDCGVSPKTVRAYYQILEDTLLGHTIEPWRKSRDRRLIETAKFYLFDVGVVRALKGMQRIQPRTVEFGRAFEHFLIEEVRAYLAYRQKICPMRFWRTTTGLEVDLIVGELDAAIEFKGSERLRNEEFKGLRALCADQPVRRAFMVCLEPVPRQVGDILVLPWQEFCRRLWAGDII